MQQIYEQRTYLKVEVKVQKDLDTRVNYINPEMKHLLTSVLRVLRLNYSILFGCVANLTENKLVLSVMALTFVLETELLQYIIICPTYHYNSIVYQQLIFFEKHYNTVIILIKQV